MVALEVEERRILGAWQGRVSGCLLGKPVELLSMLKGRGALLEYLEKVGALPLRDYVPAGDDPLVNLLGVKTCKGHIERFEPDDDINYTVLALLMLEEHGLDLDAGKVGRTWLKTLPAAQVFTAEKEAYRTLLSMVGDEVFVAMPPGVDVIRCSDNPFNEWIGAQIRADMYGWVRPGDPHLAADLARRDACFSHRGDGVHGAAFVAAMAAAIPATDSMEEAAKVALSEIPSSSGAAEAVRTGLSLAGKDDAAERLIEKYADLSPAHTLNNLAASVWSVCSFPEDFGAAIGEVVAMGWDTDCNGATVGGLWGLSDRDIPAKWTDPWQGKVAVTLAGVGELELSDLVSRTMETARNLNPART